MKIIRILLFLLLVSIVSVINMSCDDSGLDNPKYNVTLNYQNLKHIDPLVNGMYEAWVSFPPVSGDLSSPVFISCGRFNIDNTTGGIVDSAGSPIALKLKYIPANVNSPIDAILSIEPPADHDSLPSLILMGGPASLSNNIISASMNMRYSKALGIVAENLPNATARYILDTPSDTGRSYFFNGLWFCDTTGSSLITNMNTIPDSVGWTYEAWVFDKRDSANYSLGKFSNPNISR